MNTEFETLAESWRRLESALGGRFRDGEECPPILRLFRAAVNKVQRMPDDDSTAPLREHLEVCPVCRRTWNAALMAAQNQDESRAPRDELKAAITKTHGRTEPLDGDQSLADELAELATRAQASAESTPEPVAGPCGRADLGAERGSGDSAAASPRTNSAFDAPGVEQNRFLALERLARRESDAGHQGGQAEAAPLTPLEGP
jgi:hypothetical protein